MTHLRLGTRLETSHFWLPWHLILAPPSSLTQHPTAILLTTLCTRPWSKRIPKTPRRTSVIIPPILRMNSYMTAAIIYVKCICICLRFEKSTVYVFFGLWLGYKYRAVWSVVLWLWQIYQFVSILISSLSR